MLRCSLRFVLFGGSGARVWLLLMLVHALVCWRVGLLARAGVGVCAYWYACVRLCVAAPLARAFVIVCLACLACVCYACARCVRGSDVMRALCVVACALVSGRVDCTLLFVGARCALLLLLCLFVVCR